MQPKNGNAHDAKDGPPFADFESTFKQFIESLSGAEVHDVSAAGGQRGGTADYLLFDRSVVAELKCLEKDCTEDLAAFFANECQQRNAVGYGHFAIDVDRLARSEADREELARRALKSAGGTALENGLKRANQQIRSTKARLGLPQAAGLLIIANVTSASFAPEHAVWLIKNLFLKTRADGGPAFSSIDAALYMPITPEHHSIIGGVPLVPCQLVPHRDRLADLDTAVEQLMQAWASFLGHGYARMHQVEN